MSAANDKASKEATGLVMEFLSPNKDKANGPNNYLAWAGAMHTTIGARYGPMTSEVIRVVGNVSAPTSSRVVLRMGIG